MVHCCKYMRRRVRGGYFCIKIEPTSLQGLKGERSIEIGSRNRHQMIYYRLHRSNNHHRCKY